MSRKNIKKLNFWRSNWICVVTRGFSKACFLNKMRFCFIRQVDFFQYNDLKHVGKPLKFTHSKLHDNLDRRFSKRAIP